MTAKHTPGPWVVDDSNPNLVARLVDGVYEYVCAVEPSSFSTREYSKEQEESDARLIAAGPDLLKSLQKFINVMESCSYYPDTASDRHALCQAAVKAKAAIFKATGE